MGRYAAPTFLQTRDRSEIAAALSLNSTAMNIPLSRTSALLPLALLATAAPLGAAEVGLTKVADTTDAAAGTAGNFGNFLDGFISDSGYVLIEAEASGNVGLWTGQVGAPLDLFYLEGDTIPGGGDSFDAVNLPVHLSDTGKVSAQNRLASASTGIFNRPLGGPTGRVAVVGDAAPGTAETFTDFQNPGQALNDNGDLVFWGGLTGAVTADTGLWDDAGNLLIREGDASTIPGVDIGDIYAEVANNDGGQIMFASFLTGAITGATNEAMFAGPPAAPVLVVREGDDASAAAASLPPMTEFFRPSGTSLNDAGQCAFRCTLRGPGIQAGNTIRFGGLYSNDITIWTNAGGSLELIAQEGQAAPGFAAAPNNPVFTEFSQPVMCDNGDIVFHATIVGVPGSTPPTNNHSNEAIYRYTPGSGLTLIAREGGAAPGTAGAIFANSLSVYAVGDSGRVAFRANLTGGDATASLNHGLWIDEDDGMGAMLVLRESDTYKPTLATTETITDVTISVRNDGGAGGRPSSLPASNVLMKIAHSSGNGMFIFGPPPFEIIAVSGQPAPGTATVFDTIRPVATMAADGRVIFRAHLPISDYQGIWYEEPGALPTDPFVLTKMVQQGDPVPGLGGPVHQNMTRLPAWNDAGDAAYFSSIRYDAGLGIDKWNTFGVWSDPDGSAGASLLIRGGDSGIIGIDPAAEVYEVSRRAPPINSAGQVPYTVLFREQVPPVSPPPAPGEIHTNNNSAIGVFDGAQNRIVAWEGETDALSPVNPGAVFDYLLNNSELFISDTGILLFEGLLREGTGGPAVTPLTETGLWVADANTGTLFPPIAQGGMAAPGTGGDYLRPVQAALSRKAVLGGTPVVFRSTLTGGAITGANDTAIFYSADAGFAAPSLIAQEGDAAPSTATTFLDFTPPMMNDDGDYILRAYLNGGGEGIWSTLVTGLPTSIDAEVLSGDAAPGIAGASFDSFDPPIAGDGGHVAFVGYVSGGGVAPTNDSGIWVRNPGGGLSLLIREGLTLEVLPGVMRTIASFQVGGYNNGDRPQQMVSINGAGRMVFWVEFTNGDSAVIRTQL